ncbi:hypothetical protein [Pseudoclavibacter sp. RFBA6]|uniref:hypothetical protein n=1 Tax=Pseudoclavibacter sp. RFBA6 TaxID=2080573 RepID=UPI000CE86EF5|nr:hypothetical protein [Pseudoclavibacter sp. RFBA6]PPG38755.1 hypothetical protein C5C17_13790 [Pseudoclavibacter sp. RFBA6]
MGDNAEQMPIFELHVTEHELNYLNMLVQTDAATCHEKVKQLSNVSASDAASMYATDAAIADALVERIENILDRIDKEARPANLEEQ